MHSLSLLLKSKKPLIMGILNVSPDSFSDGGRYTTESRIVAQTDKMVAEGADIIDVGGESTRPFSSPVSLEEELRRVLPAIDIIRKRHSVPISIDTTKADVARRALEAGADWINDISALRFDPAMVEIARRWKAPTIIMHMRGVPGDMQQNPRYDNVVAEITAFLHERVAWAESRGLPKEQLIVDPGIGFGKTLEHNLAILGGLEEFRTLNLPLLIGHSRKSFLGGIVDKDVDDRDLASAIVAAYCVLKRTTILRVHDVDKTRQAVRIITAIASADGIKEE